jgi:DNA-binding transcriptional LysR family regulator
MLNRHRHMSINLRHALTFITVADLGTVSKAAAQLRIAQPALSRQIGALEQELGLKLFDRVGSRLVLTGEGEQLLGDCRVLLNYASTVSERAQLLQRGDTGVLKVASSPQVIEGVLAGFLSEFAGRYPNVQVKLVEVLGWPETVAMLERGEIHLGQTLVRAVQPGDTRFGTHPLEPVDLLAAAQPRMLTGESKTWRSPDLRRIRCCCSTAASCSAATSMLPAALPASRRIFGLKAGDPTLCWRWLSADMASPSSRRPCGPTGTRCGSSA